MVRRHADLAEDVFSGLDSNEIYTCRPTKSNARDLYCIGLQYINSQMSVVKMSAFTIDLVVVHEVARIAIISTCSDLRCSSNKGLMSLVRELLPVFPEII